MLALCLKLLFFGNTTYHLETSPPSVTCGTVQPFFERSFHHTRRPSLIISAWLITSSAQLRPAAPSSASSAAQLRAVPFPGAPWRALPCGAVLCNAVRYCAMLCGVVCCAVWVSALLSLCRITKKMHPQLSSAHSYIWLTAAQRRAVPCPAVLFHAADSFEQTAVPGT